MNSGRAERSVAQQSAAGRQALASLRVCTYNIHKGFSQFNRRMVIHELRERLRTLDADVVFLQEVQGLHMRHSRRHADWPKSPQHEFLAEDFWMQTAYGGNALYDHGHHGNAILSRYPILSAQNQDISDHIFERRGLLHCEIALPGFDVPVHCACIHLGLTSGTRRRQMQAIVERMHRLAGPRSPLIIAGDFNDWRNRADDQFCDTLGVTEAFAGERGRPARSFPSTMPVLRLDRIYVRGFSVENAQAHFGLPWSRISDHAALTAQLAPR